MTNMPEHLYQVGEWILIRFPQEESGANRKLSRPWHGPYRIVTSNETGVVATKIYKPSSKNIQVHKFTNHELPDAQLGSHQGTSGTVLTEPDLADP